MMLQIVVAVAGTVCGAGFAVFSRTVDRLPPVTDIQHSLNRHRG